MHRRYVVLDSVNMAFREEDSIFKQIWELQIFSNLSFVFKIVFCITLYLTVVLLRKPCTLIKYEMLVLYSEKKVKRLDNL